MTGEEPARSGPFARVLGSLANALLGLGLPTIRQWLRDRLGPEADVEHVRADGSVFVLEGVRVPIGARGALLLSRATATITPLAPAGAQALVLHAFDGVLTFGATGGPSLRAELSFEETPSPDDLAWASGQLEIRALSWTPREGAPASEPLRGHARLLVSRGEWRLDAGRLDGEMLRARFAGGGALDRAPPSGDDALLVPRALSIAALSIEHGRVVPLFEAASGLVGRELRLPAFVPLDAHLDGELSWSAAAGARTELRVDAAGARASLRASFEPTGRALEGRVEGELHPAAVMRRSGLASAATPRDEDVVRIDLALEGELRHPIVKGSLRAGELGFRLGRPRFVPPVVLRDVVCDALFEGGRLALRATILARGGEGTIDADVDVREPSTARARLRAEPLGPALLRELASTLGARVTIADDVVGAVDLALAASAPRVTGTVALAASASRIVLGISADGARVTGTLGVRDLLAARPFSGSVAPIEGELGLALDVARDGGGLRARGPVEAPRLVLGIRGVPYVLEEASAEVSIDAGGLTYEALRFGAHGGAFGARGAIPFGATASAPLLVLELERGGADLAEAIAPLATGAVAIRAAREGDRPTGEVWIPRELGARGELRVLGGGALEADVALDTPAGTSLTLALRVGVDAASPARRTSLVGSSLDGAVALEDAAASGVLGPAASYEPRGVVAIDVVVSRASEGGHVVLASLRAASIACSLPSLGGAPRPTVVAVAPSARIRLDAGEIAWKDAELGLWGGVIACSGVHRRGETIAALSVTGVGVEDLPSIGGREVRAYVRGRLSGTLLGRREPGAVRAGGRLTLDDAALPALELLRPALARYGLRPPSEDASSPVTATLSVTERALSLRDVSVDLRGATLRGGVAIARERDVEGRAEITLEEDYLRTSKVLTLPRVLAERLAVPVFVDGPLDRPRVHADLGASLGRFLKDNRVSALVTSAVEEAQLLLGRAPPVAEAARAPEPPIDPGLEAALREALDAHSVDWEQISATKRRRAAAG